jgi:putative FmdB family regulatory protein
LPTYEYACKACGEHIEVVQSFKDDPLTACGLCGGDLRKVFSPIGITFKGSGFYKTDSRSSGKSSSRSEPAKSDSSAKTESASKSDPGKSESTKTESSKSDPGKSGSTKSDSSKSSSSSAAAS